MRDTPRTDKAAFVLKDWRESYDVVLVSFAEELEGELDDLRRELNDTIRACHIWQDGHSTIVEDRDYWRAEAERWRALSQDAESVIDTQTAPCGG